MEKSPLRKLYELLDRRNKLGFLSLVFLMLINALLELAGVGAIPGIVILLTDPNKLVVVPHFGSALIRWHQTDSQQLFMYAIGSLFLVFLLKNSFLIYLNYKKGKFVRTIQISLSNQMFNKYLRAPFSFHLGSNIAELMRNVSSEVNQLVNQILLPILEFLLSLMMAVSILSLLFYAEPLVSLVTLSVFGMVSFGFLRLTKAKIRFYGNEALRMRNVKSRIVLNSLNLIKEIKTLGKESYFSKTFDQTMRKEAYVTLHKTVMEKVPRAILEILAIAMMFSIIFIMMSQERNSGEMIAFLALFAVAAARLMPISNQISTSITNIRYAFPSITPIFNDIKYIEEESTGKGVTFDTLNGVISIVDLAFSYQKSGKTVIDGLNLTIPLGSSVAFVGPSGAGKTTLADILLGILPPTRGTVLCNQTRIYDGIGSWRRQVGYIPQQITLVNDTIESNICLGMKKNDIDEGRIMEVIRLVQLEELIRELPLGIKTELGDKGLRISGGQRQRIGIARAIYHNPSILIMDEATSALDNVTERNLVDALEKVRENRTFIIIAHRLTTIKNCDIIFYLQEGKKIAQGTYDELKAINVGFKEMSEV